MAYEERKFETRILDMNKMDDENIKVYLDNWFNDIGPSGGIFFHCYRSFGPKLFITISFNALKANNANHTTGG
jgi:hypothetical protein